MCAMQILYVSYLLFRVVGRINETHWELRRKVLLKLNLLL
jgi:hypothetical protein